MVLRAGAAIVDITPPPGLLMAGFGARVDPAIGTHDPLTVRALAVNDTAIVVVDIIGIDQELSRRVREACVLPAERVVITALHNHGGPAVERGPGGQHVDAGYMRRLESALLTAIDTAVKAQRPATLSIGMGADPEVGSNRRHAGGIVDRALPVLRLRGDDGKVFAVFVSYACHPVTLGADNLLWTADYPHYVRTAIEDAYPGATAVFATGCCGDVNTGHSAYASQTLAASNDRTFARAEQLGRRIAAAALAAPETPVDGPVTAADAMVGVALHRREVEPLPELAARWTVEAEAHPERAALLAAWADWARNWNGSPVDGTWTGRVSALRWGGVPIVALPGEIFTETALSIRAALGNEPAFVLELADASPGYIPPRSEFAFGGYEVEEAHRYIGMPGTFAPGTAEKLADAACALLGKEGASRSPG
jgi:hypothetical protein